jgi:hypothetical protein
MRYQNLFFLILNASLLLLISSNLSANQNQCDIEIKNAYEAEKAPLVLIAKGYEDLGKGMYIIDKVSILSEKIDACLLNESLLASSNNPMYKEIMLIHKKVGGLVNNKEVSAVKMKFLSSYKDFLNKEVFPIYSVVDGCDDFASKTLEVYFNDVDKGLVGRYTVFNAIKELYGKCLGNNSARIFRKDNALTDRKVIYSGHKTDGSVGGSEIFISR